MTIDEYKNKHIGERVFIIGNGPSLTNTPLDRLSDEYTIGVNRIDLIFDETSWRPTYYVSAGFRGEEFIESCQKVINQEIPSFLYERSQESFSDEKNVEFLNHKVVNFKKRKNAVEHGRLNEVWSTDVSKSVCNFGSVISVTAQLAVYMGFDEIYFVGCDLYSPDALKNDYLIFKGASDPGAFEPRHDTILEDGLQFISKSNKPLRSAINGISFKIRTSNILHNITSDDQHFSYEYNMEKIYLPRENKKLNRVHKIIKLASEQYNFEVFNATIGGHLEVYPRIDLENVLNSDQ